jgi:hypothetical protein
MFYSPIKPTIWRSSLELAHEVTYEAIAWSKCVRAHLRDLDYWVVVIVAFCLGMAVPPRWRFTAIQFWIDVAIALRAGLPKI